ncbi:MAG: ATPase, T2SS/T4P/T4SS family [Acidimicrobiia bacterium]|nr:ATPase, T2SS/T4P/T4SS family [Acidimicrobiia bacterium]
MTATDRRPGADPQPMQPASEPTRDERRSAFDAAAVLIRNSEAPVNRMAGEALAIKAVSDLASGRLNPARLESGRPMLDAAAVQQLCRWVVDELYGLGPVEALLRDPLVEEIAVTRWDLTFVYRSDGSVVELHRPLWDSPSALVDWLGRLARTKSRTERAFNSQSPLLVLDLGGGLRLEAHRDCSLHTGFTLRRNTLKKATLSELSAGGMMPVEVADFLAASMRCRSLRTVFTGGTGDGKTTLVRACLAELDRLTRVVTIEDTAELDFFDDELHPNVESWEARTANAEGVGGVTLGDLVRHALRARPDWLIVGECRDYDAAVPMLGAMTHGQSSLTTVHAQSARDALGKLALYLMEGGMDDIVAYSQLAMAVDFVVHVQRDGETGRRHVHEIIEVTPVEGRRTGHNVVWSARGPVPATMSNERAQRLRDVGFDPRRLGGLASMNGAGR